MVKSIFTLIISTPLGQMIAGGNDDGLCLLEFQDRPALPKELNDLKRILNAEIINDSHPILEQTGQQIEEYFKRERKDFNIKLNAPGTDFQKRIWEILQEIPYGTTRSYKDQAIRYGNNLAIRAVAKANGDNRISIIIPCHRIIGSDGKLIGYGGGMWRKQKLLEHEAQVCQQLIFD
ncbi:MAG: methylated-DNA--[protein]-cysteine S-methyltransferase [Candidatus Kapabacteria bacterium]|nr:methylated-DNA--[protein]-cysteine S-methyltransferase [Candidatus Kapabacteria bacterium]